MFHENLKHLRQKAKMSQQALSDQLGIARTTLGDYERGKTEPNIDMIISLANLFEVTIDDLLKKNLVHLDLEILKNKELRVLAISVDQDNRENIELVDTKAQAGYLQSFNDPEFIRDLPKIHFPNMPDGTYRGFKIEGDSMLPVESGSVVVCTYVESLHHLKDGKTYIVVSKDEGLVYKRVKKMSDKLLLFSDNPLYPPYEINYDQISEAWEFYALLSFSDAKISEEGSVDYKLDAIQEKIRELTQSVSDLQKN